MSDRETIKQRQRQLETELNLLKDALRKLDREERYKSYLRLLVEADMGEAPVTQTPSAFKEEVLAWLQPPRKSMSIKGWVLDAVHQSAGQMTTADLRDRFKEEFGSSRVASIRQYLTKPFGLVQKRKDGTLNLTKQGRAELRKLEQTRRG